MASLMELLGLLGQGQQQTPAAAAQSQLINNPGLMDTLLQGPKNMSTPGGPQITAGQQGALQRQQVNPVMMQQALAGLGGMMKERAPMPNPTPIRPQVGNPAGLQQMPMTLPRAQMPINPYLYGLGGF